MRNFDNSGIMVNCAVLHPNQGEIIFGDQSGRVRIWDLTTNEAHDLYDDCDDIAIRSIAISKNATKLVAGNAEGICYIWSSVNGEEFVPMQELAAHPDHYVLKCQFSPDAHLLATCSSDKSCKVFELC
mmetsp:Transcript_94730/g.130473  ORF Transcript_94730/g.130473 Transcript_94730/m.130473 type:complete len:128 (+) Transcript_94730:338-721(+)